MGGDKGMAMQGYDEAWIEQLKSKFSMYKCVEDWMHEDEFREALYEKVLRSKGRIADEWEFYALLKACPYASVVMKEGEEYLKFDCSQGQKLNFDLNLEEKLYVWDSATDEYTETWQKADYKGNKIEP